MTPAADRRVDDRVGQRIDRLVLEWFGQHHVERLGLHRQSPRLSVADGEPQVEHRIDLGLILEDLQESEGQIVAGGVRQQHGAPSRRNATGSSYRMTSIAGCYSRGRALRPVVRGCSSSGEGASDDEYLPWLSVSDADGGPGLLPGRVRRGGVGSPGAGRRGDRRSALDRRRRLLGAARPRRQSGGPRPACRFGSSSPSTTRTGVRASGGSRRDRGHAHPRGPRLAGGPDRRPQRPSLGDRSATHELTSVHSDRYERRPVLAEDLAQDVVDLAERGPGPQRLLHRRQQVPGAPVAVARPRRGPPSTAAASRGARALRPLDLPAPGPRRCAGGRAPLAVVLEPVHADDHALTRSMPCSTRNAASSISSLVEAGLDGGDAPRPCRRPSR